MRYKVRTALVACTIGLLAAAAAVDLAQAKPRSIRTRGAGMAQPKRSAPPQVGGASCAAATVVPLPLPYTDTDTTCGAPTAVEEYNSAFCPNLAPYPGPELIYQLELGDTNAVQISLTTGPVYDGALFLVDDCTVGTTCVGALDICEGVPCSTPTQPLTEIVAPGQTVTTEVGDITYPPVDAGTYYIYVDSYYESGASSCGNYTLRVEGTVPVELMKFTVD